MGQVVSINDHKKKKRRRSSFKWLRFFFLGLVCCLIGFGISQSPLFDIKSIEISGNQNIDSQILLELSGIEEGQHIYSFSAGRAETMIATNPLVEQVTVTRNLPNRVRIQITERKAVAAVAAGDGVLLVDKEGYVLKKQKLFDGLDYMLIIGVDDLFESDGDEAEQESAENEDAEADDKADDKADEEADEEAKEEADNETADNDSEAETAENEETADDVSQSAAAEELLDADQEAYAAVKNYDDIQSGTRLNSKKLETGLNVSMQMDQEALDIVTQINVLDVQNIIMDTVYGIKIYFGDENDIDEKFGICKSVLAEEKSRGHITKIQYIDVSVPSHPALKYNN